MIDLGTTTSVIIRAPIEDVWDALTTPELIKRWFFGVDTEADWQVGGPIVHRGEWQGKPYEDKGTVRLTGPFTVESLSPHRMLPAGDAAPGAGNGVADG